MNFLKWLFRNTLDSVPFGIIMMILVAAYVSIGSGFPSVREWFETNELMFFTLWPFRIIMALLVISLATVTIRRIPLTPPRYGVWMIHLGIILLVITSSAYYSQKIEGLMIVPVGGTSSYFYDGVERALYARVGFQRSLPHALKTLPRFHTYSATHGNQWWLEDHWWLRRKDLHDIQLSIREVNRETGSSALTPLHAAVGVGDPITFDIVGYWPYADIEHTWRTVKEGGSVGIELRDVHDGEEHIEHIVADDETYSITEHGPIEFQHRHLQQQADVDLLIEGSKRIHELDVRIGDIASKQFVQPGDTIKLEDAGYSLRVEGFVPQFPLSSDGKPVDVLSVLVTRTEGEPKVFRRMVLNGIDTQTDFLLNVEGAGPMGQRQTAPVDDQLTINYRFSDPLTLMPTQERTTRYLFLTSDDSQAVTRLALHVSNGNVVERFDAGDGHFTPQASTPILGSIDAEPASPLSFKRVEQIRLFQKIRPVPKPERDSQVGQEGTKQVAAVRVTCGSWSDVFYVPYSLWAWDVFIQSTSIRIPGSNQTFEIALGNKKIDTPMAVRLDKFEAIPYAGAPVAASSMMRDFKSHVTITDRVLGGVEQKTVRLNEPAYFNQPVSPNTSLTRLLAPSWIMYQAQWDADGQKWTVLGVANRPAVPFMLASCGLVVVGLLYAFYLKPLIIRSMKDRAIREAEMKKRAKEEMFAGA